MAIIKAVQSAVANSLNKLYALEIEPSVIPVKETKPGFEGDYSIALFPLVKYADDMPEVFGPALGQQVLSDHCGLISSFNITGSFLNFAVSEKYLLDFLHDNFNDAGFISKEKNGERIVIEYSSPNTNKPLHLGHLRNIFLGWSMAAIYKASGYDVVKTCIANDRGIHICKSMIAYAMYSDGATPESTGIKGDHLVGDYYVRFNDEYKVQVDLLVKNGISKEDAELQAPIMQFARQALVDWETAEANTMKLWKMMNDWVYAGFDATYRRIGVDFDKVYYESNTYLTGRNIVEKGLEEKVFFRKENGSVCIDLTSYGLDEKIVQREDGTSVYMTQDIGLVKQKQEDFGCDRSIYVVGNEQDYHFKVLKIICQKLKMLAAYNIFHLSYGMVELPEGRMKAREGKVVDADNIIDEMARIAEAKTAEQGKIADFAAAELQQLYDTIGIGALKFFLLRVNPKIKIVFNPDQSIDLNGFTATFIQYAYVRINAILSKEKPGNAYVGNSLLPLERSLLLLINKYSGVIDQACIDMNPSLIAIYAYNLARMYNSFYAAYSVLNAESTQKKELRLQLSKLTGIVIKDAMNLLGISVPDRM